MTSGKNMSDTKITSSCIFDELTLVVILLSSSLSIVFLVHLVTAVCRRRRYGSIGGTLLTIDGVEYSRIRIH
jgi:hypothetical protein